MGDGWVGVPVEATPSSSRPSCNQTAPSQHGHPGRSTRVVIATRKNSGQSPTPTTLTSGKPTRNSHVRVGSVSKRACSGSQFVRHTQIRRAPARARRPSNYTNSRTDPKRQISRHSLSIYAQAVGRQQVVLGIPETILTRRQPPANRLHSRPESPLPPRVTRSGKRPV